MEEADALPSGARSLRSRPGVVVPLILAVAGTMFVLLGSSDSRTRAQPEVYPVPVSIAGDCSRAVDGEINRFLMDVPDGAIVRFATAGCYAQDGSIEVRDKRDLTIEGGGSTFRAITPGDMCRANWRVIAGSKITLRDLVARGVNTTGFDGPRRTDWCQHGFSLESVDGARVLTSKSYDTAGDPLAIGPDRRKQDYCAVPPNRNILVDGFHGFNSGRTVSISHGDGVTIQRSYFGDMYDNAIDIETDDDCESARNIRILENRFGRYRFAMLAYTGSEPAGRGGGLEISGNVIEAEPRTCFPAILLKPPDGVIRHNFIIRGNALKTLGDGISIAQARHARIENNEVSKDYNGCGVDSTAVVAVEESHDVNVFGNRAVTRSKGGFGGEVRSDARSTNIVQVAPESLAALPTLPLPDDPPPVVRIVSPADGTALSGTVTVTAEASGGNLRRGEFMIDNAVVKVDHGPGYTYAWDTAGAAKGSHTIKVTLYNAFGLASSNQVTVVVD